MNVGTLGLLQPMFHSLMGYTGSSQVDMVMNLNRNASRKVDMGHACAVMRVLK